MAGAQVTKRDGQVAALSAESIAALASRVTGEVVEAGSPGWTEARTVWNGMIDRRPGLVVRCATAADVEAAVRFAGEHDLLVAVRGGGHNIAGNGVCDGGLQIDLSRMKKVAVDPAALRAKVEPGATLADLDAATQAHGLATPVGVNSTTGVAGLTLGGGYGWLTRMYGLTIDNLVSVEIVTADGMRRTASANENQDLFWAVRGGGGNFGVVTSFEFALHPVGPQIVSGLIVHPLAGATDALREYRAITANAPEELAAWCVLRKAPPLPFLPESAHWTEVLVMPVFWGGDPARADEAFAPLKAVGNPIAVAIGPTPYTEWQKAFDPLLTPGARNYWKSHNISDLSDELIDVLVEATGNLPGRQCEMFLSHMAGAVARVPPDATAYAHRDVNYIINVHARWDSPDEDERCIAWARGFYRTAAPYATGGVYVNFQPADELGDPQRAYGPNRARLEEIKGRYDPMNRFRVNQNIRPAVAAV